MPNSLENLTASAVYTCPLSDRTLHFRKFTADDYGRREAHIKEQRFRVNDKLTAIMTLTHELRAAVDSVGTDQASRNQMFAIMLGSVKDAVQESLTRPSYVSIGEETEFEMSRHGVAYDVHLTCLEYQGDFEAARMLVYSLTEPEMTEVLTALSRAREREAIKNSGSPSSDESRARGSTEESESSSI